MDDEVWTPYKDFDAPRRRGLPSHVWTPYEAGYTCSSVDDVMTKPLVMAEEIPVVPVTGKEIHDAQHKSYKSAWCVYCFPVRQEVIR